MYLRYSTKSGIFHKYLIVYDFIISVLTLEKYLQFNCIWVMIFDKTHSNTNSYKTNILKLF